MKKRTTLISLLMQLNCATIVAYSILLTDYITEFHNHNKFNYILLAGETIKSGISDCIISNL